MPTTAHRHHEDHAHDLQGDNRRESQQPQEESPESARIESDGVGVNRIEGIEREISALENQDEEGNRCEDADLNEIRLRDSQNVAEDDVVEIRV